MIFQVHPLNKKISLPVLQFKKSANVAGSPKTATARIYFAMWMKRLTLSSTKNLRKAQVIPMLRFLLMMAMKKAAMKKLLVTQIPMMHYQIDFSGQIHYVECRDPEILGTMAWPKISSIFSSTMNTSMKSSGTALPMRVPRVTQRSQPIERKFQRISASIFWLESTNFHSWQCTGILINLLEWRDSKNHPQAAFCNSGKVLPSCWPGYRGPSGSALQSSPDSYSARTEDFWSLHAWQKQCILDSLGN